MDLSVVLIAKNEEKNIARLIESVLARTANVTDKEILLVDSNSTDRTIEIASQYPIRIVRLLPGENIRFCAAAGRFIGTHQTSGDYVLFLDGDHELYEGWLQRAMTILENNADIGVVGGFRIDIPKDTPTDEQTFIPTGEDGTYLEMVHGGPGALYRRSVLDEVGTFTPYLISDEEPELCLRIRHAGYRVVRTDYPVVYHRTDPEDTFPAMFARRKRNLYLGFGQNLRYHAKTGLLSQYIRERWYALPIVEVLIIGVISLIISLEIHRLIPFELWLVAVFLLLVAYTIHKRSLYRMAHSLLNRIFVLEGSIKGIWLHPLNPDDYLQHIEVVK